MTMRCLSLLVLGLFLTGLAGFPAHAEEEPVQASVSDLDARTKKNLVKAARGYLDPDVEFLWEPKKLFVAQLDVLREMGMTPIKDLGLLKSIVYEGRHFRPRFDDKSWRKLNDVNEWKKVGGLYWNLKSDDFRFAFSQPKGYPKESALDRKRDEPYPLLLVFHEDSDLIDRRGAAADFPGSVALARIYPKNDFAGLYEDWFVVAPIAPRARFLDEEGVLRHRFSTGVLREFWQRYHIDFDRIVLDGRLEAATLAGVFPHVFAGLVLRGGDPSEALMANLRTLPIYVVGDPELKKKLDASGHPDVTVGDEKGLLEWLNARKRVTPRKFSWRVPSADFRFGNWILVGGAQFSPETGLEVEVLDTEEHPNTIKIDAKGVETISLFLNDDVVDLDRDVTLVLNGKTEELGKVDRQFAQIFEREPSKVRKSMYFGWLFPVFLPEVRLPPPPAVEESTAPAEEDVVGTPEDEAKAQKFWDKAVEADEAGDKDKARQLYQLVVDVGATSYRGKAQAKLEALNE